MRFLFLIVIAVAIAGIAYPFVGNFSMFVDAALWIYAIVIAFLIDKAMTRRSELKKNVNVELARLRHIYHVAEQMPAVFRRKVHALLAAYEKKIAADFEAHDRSTDSFRELSHAIYSFVPKTRKEDTLYADLLQTLQDLTLGRQRIQFELLGELSPYDWFLLVVILASLLTLLLVDTAALVPLARLGLASMAVLVVLIPMEMLWKDDRSDVETIRKFQKAYGGNVPRGK